jgi:hypothetical protein
MEERRLDAKLWIGVLLPPVAALGAQWLSYSLVHQGCVHQTKAMVLGPMVLAGLACVAAFALARGVRRRLPAGSEIVSVQRARFLAISGEVFSAFFLFVILAMAIPDFVLRTCD